jgi:IS30 family transposase
MDDTEAAAALAGFSSKLNRLASRCAKSYPATKARRWRDTVSKGVKLYFCDLHGHWQRGSCESTNGMLRRYWSKAIDLSLHAQG